MSVRTTSVGVSVVVVIHDEREHLRRTVHSLLSGLPLDGEILVIDDWGNHKATDGR